MTNKIVVSRESGTSPAGHANGFIREDFLNKAHFKFLTAGMSNEKKLNDWANVELDQIMAATFDEKSTYSPSFGQS